MPIFYIKVQHDVVEEAILEVEAPSMKEALRLARIDPQYENDAEWELTDWTGDNSYIPLDDNYNEIEEK
jgi:hypothetical protein